MSTIIPFQFETHALRVQVDDASQLWFNANDVCEALQLGNARQALESHVDADDVQKLDTIDSLGRTQRANHVNESGLYALILGSTKDAAKRFKRWVTSEVLPSIRKTGAYATPAVAALPAPTQDRVSSLLLIGDAVAKVTSSANWASVIGRKWKSCQPKATSPGCRRFWTASSRPAV